MRRSPALLIALPLAACVLGGCSPSQATAGTSQRYTDDQRAQWSLPLDPYIRTPVDVVVTDYAENLLVEDCMAGRGVDWPIPRVDVNALTSETTSPSGRLILTPDLARRYGYHDDPVLPEAVTVQMMQLNSRALDPSESAALDACIVEARQTLPLPAVDQIGAQLANQALGAASQDTKVQAAAENWRTCMVPAGVSDLPEAPYGDDEGMPTPSLIAAYALEEPTSTAGPQEIATAVTDADCRASSGYDDALYAAEWQQQASALAENTDVLTREGEANTAYLDAARRIIADRTGA